MSEQVQYLILPYCAAFKSPDHFAKTSVTLVANSLTCDIASTYRTGIAGLGFGRLFPAIREQEFGSVWSLLYQLSRRNEDQFSPVNFRK